jgi:transcriptional regulator with XRE-family HTH domain
VSPSSSRSVPQRFGTKLKHARTSRGLSQTKLAAQWLLDARTLIPQLELGRRYPSLDIIRRASAYFETDVDYWLLDDVPVENLGLHARPGTRLEHLAAERLPVKLRHLREQHQLSERELGDALGVTRAHIYNLEAGRKQISPDLLVRIVDYMQISASSLLDDTIDLPGKY